MTAIKSGDLVVLKSGGPVMTVDTVNTDMFDDDKVTGVLCVWFVGEKLERVRFDHRAIEPVTAQQTSREESDALEEASGDYKLVLDEMVAAMTGLEWPSPGGLIQMKLADGHQAIQPIAFSRTKYNPDAKRVDLVDIQYFAAECVNPPPGVKSLDWVKGGMQGAKCN